VAALFVHGWWGPTLSETNETEGVDPSSGRPEQAVKEPSSPPAPARHPARRFRYLEGWQVGAVALWIAVMAALLAVPREAAPESVPATAPDRHQLALAADEWQRRAAEARERPLPFEVRAIGELVRRYGKAEANGRREEFVPLLSDLRPAARSAAQRQPKDLARLMAIQSELFRTALDRWESGHPGVELDELAGGLRQRAQKLGWFSGGRLLMTPTERDVLFRVRWVELTGLRGRAPFTPTLDDWRVYFGFLLAHPEGGDALDRTRKQMTYAAALSRRDPSYPLLLARGVLLYQAGAYHDATDAFGAHLAEHPDGPYALRAKNHLLAALARAEGRE
jgi:hypothetical protein